MAANAYKRDMLNRALAILLGGHTTDAGMFFTSIDDSEFADYTTVSETTYADKRLAVFLYEPMLKLVLEDMAPDFACEYADLSHWYAVNQEFGDWEYLFELPSNFLSLVAQLEEGNPHRKVAYGRDPEILHFVNYSHVVCGTDDQAYYCSANHTSAEATEPITGASYASYWTLYDEDGDLGADWEEDVAYQTGATGLMLATNALTNADGDSAYIRYVAYERYASAASPGRSDQPQYYPESFKQAFATRLAAEIALDSKDMPTVERLLQRYFALSRPNAMGVQNRHRARKKKYTAFERRTRG